MKKYMSIVVVFCLLAMLIGCAAKTESTTANSSDNSAQSSDEVVTSDNGADQDDKADAADSSEETAGPTEITKNATIYVIGMENQYDAWLCMRDSAIFAGEELGVGEVIYQAPAGGEADVQGQIALVENAINAGAAAICIACNNADALVDVVNKAKDAGIPVITFIATANTDSVDLFFSQDSYVCAYDAALVVGEYMGGEGTIGIIGAISGPYTMVQREEGFIDGITENYPNIKILDEILYANNDTARATNLTHDMMTANPEVDVIYSTNMPTSEGVLAGITEGGYDVKLCAFDNSDTLEDYIRKGVVIADPVGNFVNQGYCAVLAAVKMINGEAFDELSWNGQTFKVVDKQVDSGAIVATPDNIDDPDVQAVFHPLQFPDTYEGTDWY